MSESQQSEELLARAAKVKLLLFDCDGVLTDGRIYFLPNPDGTVGETKCFCTQDGIALQWAYRHGIETGIISGRGGLATQERARTAHMKYLYEGNTEKLPLFQKILEDSGFTADQIGYVGDDITDVPILRRAGFSAAPSNSRPQILEMVNYRIPAPGGDGAVRDVIEFILRAQGKWGEIWSHYDI